MNRIYLAFVVRSQFLVLFCLVFFFSPQMADPTITDPASGGHHRIRRTRLA